MQPPRARRRLLFQLQLVARVVDPPEAGAFVERRESGRLQHHRAELHGVARLVERAVGEQVYAGRRVEGERNVEGRLAERRLHLRADQVFAVVDLGDLHLGGSRGARDGPALLRLERQLLAVVDQHQVGLELGERLDVVLIGLADRVVGEGLDGDGREASPGDRGGAQLDGLLEVAVRAFVEPEAVAEPGAKADPGRRKQQHSGRHRHCDPPSLHRAPPGTDLRTSTVTRRTSLEHHR